jgi:ribonuclease I
LTIVEADEEIKTSESSRGLTDDEKKETPSEIMSKLDKSFSAMANLIGDEVEK